MRVARLEIEGLYDSDLHDLALERFDWRALHSEELDLFPPVIAIPEANRVATTGLAQLSALLRSGRPVHVYIEVDPLAALDDDTSTAYLELGLLAASHRGAFVQQGSIAARPELEQALGRAVSSNVAALHLVHAPLEGLELASAALYGRAHPTLVYDPGQSGDWQGHLELVGNPGVGTDWPVREAGGDNGDGHEAGPSAAFTYAHYALLAGREEHFRLIEEGEESSSGSKVREKTNLVPLCEWLGLSREDGHHSIPFIEVKRPDCPNGDAPAHLAVSRALALACGDRLDLWHTLRGFLGGNAGVAELESSPSVGESAPVVASSSDTGPEPLATPPSEGASDALREQVARDVVERLLGQLLD